jgi:hypothetical protein
MQARKAGKERERARARTEKDVRGPLPQRLEAQPHAAEALTYQGQFGPPVGREAEESGITGREGGKKGKSEGADMTRAQTHAQTEKRTTWRPRPRPSASGARTGASRRGGC